jgi:hypothetical protein
VSVHFNASNGQGHGCEVFYTSSAGKEYAKRIVDAICDASGLTNRGAKDDDDIGGLYFLSHTNEVAVLIEVCFGDNEQDTVTYYDEFDNICEAISNAIADEEGMVPEPEPDDDDVLFQATGTCSTFGGPDDLGVSASEGLAFIYDYDEAPYLFLPKQPPGTTGLARRLSPDVFYLACRWDYDRTSKLMLKNSGYMALVTAKKTGISRLAHPADWGRMRSRPAEPRTSRRHWLKASASILMTWSR